MRFHHIDRATPGDEIWQAIDVAITIVGPRIPQQLTDAVRALDVHLDDKALARLDDIFPGYRTAPEHYAW